LEEVLRRRNSTALLAEREKKPGIGVGILDPPAKVVYNPVLLG
jgi:hypothetical protein